MLFFKEGMFMVIPAKSKTGSHNIRRRNAIIVFLLIAGVVVSLCAYLLVMNSGGVVHVKSEIELVEAIDGVKIGGSAVIVLDKDIDLTAVIVIPARKNITLTSNDENEFKLAGADRASTLYVETGGVLILNTLLPKEAF
jgi:hypothetical protein